MMRVLHSVPGINWGGLEHRVLSQATWLRDRGIPVWIATPAGGALWQRAQAADLPLLAVEFGNQLLPAGALRLRALVRAHGITVIDCHGKRDSSAALFCRDLAAVIRTVHMTPRIRTSALHRLKWRRGYDGVIAASQSIAERLRQRGAYLERRDTVIGEWAEAEYFSVPPLGRADAVLHLLMVAMLRPDKGVDVAVEAMRKLRAQGIAAELQIAGAPTPDCTSFADQLRADVVASGLASVVRFLGYRDDVPRLLAACDAVVVPSRAEVQTRVAAQALAAGRPVVASNVGGLPELVRPDETGWLVPPEDATALAARLATLVRERRSLTIVGSGARRFAGRSLRMTDKMLATLTMYRAAMNAPRFVEARVGGVVEPI
jgi:glycosyltransferase involved in cell wall biosynthesis